ncbi:unnamed protein product [Ilex paraguariensis]|uniref:Uncharacterized protein n=1 Tax=Ilex paraguariensis TaxID=185542 RepID=A0ABC8U6I1_9AQUA
MTKIYGVSSPENRGVSMLCHGLGFDTVHVMELFFSEIICQMSGRLQSVGGRTQVRGCMIMGWFGKHGYVRDEKGNPSVDTHPMMNAVLFFTKISKKFLLTAFHIY